MSSCGATPWRPVLSQFPDSAVPGSGSRVVAICSDPSTFLRHRAGTILALVGRSTCTTTSTTTFQHDAFSSDFLYEPFVDVAGGVRAIVLAIVGVVPRARRLDGRCFAERFHLHHSGAGAEVSSSPQFHCEHTGSVAPQVGSGCSPLFSCAVRCF